jgi:hypothetical protein
VEVMVVLLLLEVEEVALLISIKMEQTQLVTKDLENVTSDILEKLLKINSFSSFLLIKS